MLTNKLEEKVSINNTPFESINTISMKDVSFGYSDNVNIVEDFNLNIVKNDKVLITGKNGTGKSTLLDLLVRLYDLKSGEININGINICSFDLKTLRSNIYI